MGSPLAPILTDIYMNHLIESSVQSRSSNWEDIVIPDITTTYTVHNVKFFVRYVDADTLACFNTREEAEQFLKFLISLTPSIKFTMDTECT